MIDLDALKNAIGDLDEEKVDAALAELGKSGGGDAAKALAACQAGMALVGGKYETGEYYVADLILAGELMNRVATALKPLLSGATGGTVGKMVFCTVKGDIHDIGKNIVKALLEADGIEVIDLGVDVAPEAVVKAVKDSGAKVLGMSGVLTLAIDSMEETVKALAAAGLRDSIKVIIGGAPVTADYCKKVGADAWSLNATESVGVCRKWLVG